MIRGGAKTDRLVREKEKQTHGRVQEQTAKLTEEVCSTVRQLAVGNQGNRVVLEIVYENVTNLGMGVLVIFHRIYEIWLLW